LFELSLGDFQENRVTDYQKTPRVIGSDPALNLVLRKEMKRKNNNKAIAPSYFTWTGLIGRYWKQAHWFA
jgi:S-adenosylmethionine:diacylglycerol 3-amino-3-carboxypropyl transferase